MINPIRSLASLALLLAAITLPSTHAASLLSAEYPAPDAPAPPTNNLSLYFDLTFITFQYSPVAGYLARPDLRSFPNGQPTATSVASPGFVANGNGFHSELPAGQNFSTSPSPFFPAFNPYKAELNSNGWTTEPLS